MEPSQSYLKALQAKDFKVTETELAGHIHLLNVCTKAIKALKAVAHHLTSRGLTPEEERLLADAERILTTIALPVALFEVVQPKPRLLLWPPARKALIRLALTTHHERGRVLALLGASGLFDDVFPTQPTKPTDPLTESRWEIEKRTGKMGELISADKVLKPGPVLEQIGGRVYRHGYGAWAILAAGAKSEDEAKRVGLRAQKSLIGRRNLPSSVPAFHQDKLYVGFPGGVVELPPLT